MTTPSFILHVPAGEPTQIFAQTFPVSSSITRMTDLCRALGLLEPWQTATCLDTEAMIRVNTIRLGRAKVDIDARTVNGTAIEGESDIMIEAELALLDKVVALCGVKGTIAFVAVKMPEWIPAKRGDTFWPEPLADA